MVCLDASLLRIMGACLTRLGPHSANVLDTLGAKVAGLLFTFET